MSKRMSFLTLAPLLAAVVLGLTWADNASATDFSLGTAIPFRGHLKYGGVAANGEFDFEYLGPALYVQATF